MLTHCKSKTQVFEVQNIPKPAKIKNKYFQKKFPKGINYKTRPWYSVPISGV